MRVSCERDFLLAGLKKVARALPNASAHPGLQNLLLSAESNALSILATDGIILVRASVPAQVTVNGGGAVNGKAFIEIIKGCPKDRIASLAIDREVQLEIECADAIYLIGLAASENTPPILRLSNSEAVEFQMMEKVLCACLTQTLPAASKDDTRAAMTGVHMQVEGGVLQGAIVAQACDLHRLMRRRVSLLLPDEEELGPTYAVPADLRISFVLPAQSVRILGKLLRADQTRYLTLRVDGHHLQVQSNEMSFVTRLIDARYPSFGKIYPQSIQTRWKVDRDECLAALKRLNVVGREDGFRVRITPDPHDPAHRHLILRSLSHVGSGGERLVCEFWGQPAELNLNLGYLRDGLKQMAGVQAEFQIESSDQPVLIACAENPGYEVLLMPRQDRAAIVPPGDNAARARS